MVNVVYFAVSLICLIPLQFVNCQHYVGDSCTLQSTGEQGQCVLLEKCQAAIDTSFLQICGFDGPQAIVCCAGGAGGIRRVGEKSRQSDLCTLQSTGEQGQCVLLERCQAAIDTSFLQICGFDGPQAIVCCAGGAGGIRKVGDKSRQKCKEYSKYTIEDGAVISSEECAIAAVVNVVGEEISKPKEFPHMALIGFDDGSDRRLWQCGGSLISERFVLTAGHCLDDKQYGEPRYIRLGVYDNKNDVEPPAPAPQEFDIAGRIRHPDYKPPSQCNDIALLKLNKDALLNPYVRPACLNTNPGLHFNFALASGWRTVGSSDPLLKVILEYFTHAECNSSYKSNIGFRLRYGIVDQSQVCAGSHEGVKDTCQGDLGGPLQIVNTEETCMYTIIGVTSFGKACGIANAPLVYTRVANYIGWIEGIVWP